MTNPTRRLMSGVSVVVMIAGAAIATPAHADCAADIDEVTRTYQSEEWRQEVVKETVELETTEGEVEVEVQDAEPTETWLGIPPDIEAAEGYLESARAALEDGDEDACLQHVGDARTALGMTEDTATN